MTKTTNTFKNNLKCDKCDSSEVRTNIKDSKRICKKCGNIMSLK